MFESFHSHIVKDLLYQHHFKAGRRNMAADDFSIFITHYKSIT